MIFTEFYAKTDVKIQTIASKNIIEVYNYIICLLSLITSDSKKTFSLKN